MDTLDPSLADPVETMEPLPAFAPPSQSDGPPMASSRSPLPSTSQEPVATTSGPKRRLGIPKQRFIPRPASPPGGALPGIATFGAFMLPMHANGDGGGYESESDGEAELEMDGNSVPGEGGQGPPKKKRRRQALSCVECKRRKIKCDRNQPCSGCVRRGEPDKCKWRILEPMSDKYVPRSEFDHLRGQLSHLEQQLASANASNAALGLPPAQPLSLPHPHPHPLLPPPLGMNGPAGLPPPHRLGKRKAHNWYPQPPPHIRPRDSPLGWSRLGPSPHHPTHAHPDAAAHALMDGLASLDSSAAFPQRGKQRALDDVDNLLGELPLRGVCDILVDYFFDKVEWSINVLHQPSFRFVYGSLWAPPPPQRPAAHAPWLALLFSILSIGLTSMGHVEPIERHICGDLEEWRAMGDRFWVLAHRALAAANFMSANKIEVVQTLVLFSYSHLALHNQGSLSHSPYLALAVRAAINMGLHRLGKETQGAPAPTGLVKRELSRRVWWNIVCLDWHLAPSAFSTYFVHPRQFDTAEPANLDFADMRDAVEFQPKPVSERTNSSYLLAKIEVAKTVRALVDRENKDGIDQAFLLVNEKHLNDVVATRPACMVRYDAEVESANVIVKWERIMFLLGVNNSAIRMHRPYMLQGYHDPDCRRSTKVCVSAAQAILVTFEEGRLTNFPGCLWLSTVLFCYTAALILIVDSFYAPSSVLASDLTADVSRINLVHNAIGSLERIADGSEVSRRAAYTLRFLLQECEARHISLVKAVDAEATVEPSAIHDPSPDDGIIPESALNYLSSGADAVSLPPAGPALVFDAKLAYPPPERLQQWLSRGIQLLPQAPSPAGKPSPDQLPLSKSARAFWDAVIDMNFLVSNSVPPDQLGFEQGDVPPEVWNYQITNPGPSWAAGPVWVPRDGPIYEGPPRSPLEEDFAPDGSADAVADEI